MYKTVSIHNNTYQQLKALANKLQKPKSQVIDDLIKDHIERMHADEYLALKSFNQNVKKLSNRVKLPKGAKVETTNIDAAFAEVPTDN